VLEQTENVKVVESGLWLHNCGYLCSSPDWLIGETYVVEVKCPFKFRNAVLSEEIQKDKSYIVYKENNQVFVNQNHVYWHQIQAHSFYKEREMYFNSLDTK